MTENHWERIYQTTAPGTESWYQLRPSGSLLMIEHAGLDRDAAIIDVGCGTSALVDHLLELGYRNLSALDLSAAAIAASRARLGPGAERVSWYVGDATRFDCERRFDLWHDRAVFHFLTAAADRAAYVDTLRGLLRPGGQLVLASFALGGPRRCSGLEVRQYDAPRLLAELGPGFELQEQAAEDHLTPGGATQAFAYFRIRRSAADQG